MITQSGKLWQRSIIGLSALIIGICMGSITYADPVTHTITENGVDWTSGGVAGVGDVGTGNILVTGITGPVNSARLYWHGIDSGGDGNYDNANVTIDGNPVTGTAIGTATTNCWGAGNSVAYQADVTAYMAGDKVYVIEGMADGVGHSANGASIVVTFDDGNPGNNRDLAFFEGNDSDEPEGFPGEDIGWHAVLTPIDYDGVGTVGIEMHAADGQNNAGDGPVDLTTINGAVNIPDDTTLWDGLSTPSEGNGRQGLGLWDVHGFDITAAFGGVPGTVDLNLDGQDTGPDCLGLVLALVDLPAGSLPGGDSLSKELTSGPDRDGSLWFSDFSEVGGLTLNGNATQAGSVLRLTPADFGQVGSAFTTNPVTLGPAASFSTHFSFQISNSGNGGADGLAFLVQNDPRTDTAIGGAGGAIGYNDITPSLAVEFDTWFNDVALGDVDDNHVGTATNGGVGNGIAVPLGTQLDGGAVFHAWVDYDGLADMLEVRVDTVNVRPVAPTLTQAGIGLEALLGGTSAYVGFTSGTGAAVADHDILSWHLSSAIDLVVPINKLIPTAYDFTITSEGQPVWVYDKVPAEWDVTDIEGEFEGIPEDLPLDCGEATSFAGVFGMVDVSRGGKVGKKCNSDTNIWWMPGEDNTLNVQTLARCHDNKKNKNCRPTSCGALYLNYGAIAYQKDPDTGEIVLDEENNPIVIAGPTDPICLAAVDDVNGDGMFTWDGSGDEDGDGLADFLEACDIGTDPCLEDTDGDGVSDYSDDCPLEGPADPALGEILESDGCIRQSQCSDGIDNDGDTFIDYPTDAGCDDILDDIEEGICLDAFDCSDPESELVECGNGGDCACFQNIDGPSVCVDATTACAGLTECVDGSDCAFDEACVPASCCGVPVCVNTSMCLEPAVEVVNFSFEGQGPTLGRQ